LLSSGNGFFSIGSYVPRGLQFRHYVTNGQTDRQTRAVKVPTAHYPLGRILYTRTYRKLRKSAEKCNSETVRRVMTAD